MNHKIRAIAYYLPQYHPIPENDKWWGKGFTEWTNVSKAMPLFPGHKQPHYPGDLGFYDLRVPEVREEQARLAREAGIEGFCYWHYWFGNGKQLLERPFQEVLKTGKPDFPFCLGWANESWSGIWHGAKDKVLMNQEYPGVKDYEIHFYNLLPAFLDKRYIQIEGKPLFLVYNPDALPDMKEFRSTFNELALKNGLKGLFIVANSIKNSQPDWNPESFGFDAYTIAAHNRIIHEGIGSDFYYQNLKERKSFKKKLSRKIGRLLGQEKSEVEIPQHVYKYEKAAEYFLIENMYNIDCYPTVITGWDNSPRCGTNGLILTNYNPGAFRQHLKQAVSYTDKNKHKILFVKSWNEWAEGNYLEPEREFGSKFLEVFREEIINKGQL